MFLFPQDKSHVDTASYVKQKKFPNKFRKVLENEENIYKNFKNFKVVPLRGNVTHLEFHPNQECQGQYLATHSNLVELIDDREVGTASTAGLAVRYTSFQNEAFSASFRPSDGYLFAVGGEEGVLRVFRGTFAKNVKVPLRKFDAHDAPIRCVRFIHGTAEKVASCSDDKRVKIWDILSSTELDVFQQAHQDYITSISSFVDNSSLLATGSYDHMAKIWDCRLKSKNLSNMINQVNHGHPIESVMKHPTAPILYTVGGTYLKVWDLLNMQQPLYSVNTHHNTITTMAMTGNNNSRLVTAGLDKQVCIYNTSDYSLYHSMNFEHPILSIAISRDEKKMLVGCTGGKLIKSERKDKRRVFMEVKHDSLITENYRNLITPYITNQVMTLQDGIFLPQNRTLNITYFQNYFRKFKYKNALDSAMKNFSSQPVIVLSLIEELKNRNELYNALSMKDEDTLLPILLFIIKYIRDPRFTSSIIELSHTVLDIYGRVIGESNKVDTYLRKIRQVVNQEIKSQEQLHALRGLLDTVIISSTLNRTQNKNQ